MNLSPIEKTKEVLGVCGLCRRLWVEHVNDGSCPIMTQQPVTKSPPLFERRVNATLARCTATFGQRGEEYGDTWQETRFLTMAAVAKQLGISATQEQLRALACAAFVDFKYWRQLGGYKEDHYLDGINYAAYLVDEMREQTQSKS